MLNCERSINKVIRHIILSFWWMKEFYLLIIMKISLLGKRFVNIVILLIKCICQIVLVSTSLYICKPLNIAIELKWVKQNTIVPKRKASYIIEIMEAEKLSQRQVAITDMSIFSVFAVSDWLKYPKALNCRIKIKYVMDIGIW